MFAEHVAAHSSAVVKRGITAYCLLLVLPPEPARSSVLQSTMYLDVPTVRSVLSASGQVNWSVPDPRRMDADVLTDADADTLGSTTGSETSLSLLSEAVAVDSVSSSGLVCSDSALDVDTDSVSSVSSGMSASTVESSSSLGTRVAVETVSSTEVGGSNPGVAGSGMGTGDASTSFHGSVASGLGFRVASGTVVSLAASVWAEGSFSPPMKISADGVSSMRDGSGMAGTEVSGLGIGGTAVCSMGSSAGGVSSIRNGSGIAGIDVSGLRIEGATVCSVGSSVASIMGFGVVVAGSSSRSLQASWSPLHRPSQEWM